MDINHNRKVRKPRNRDKKEQQLRIKSFGPYESNAVDLYRDYNKLLSDFSIVELNSIRQINLHNYYKKDKIKRTIYCSICQLDIKQADVYSHTIDKAHRYNKLFYNFVQNYHRYGNTDYIILDNRWAVCRYCGDVIFPSFTREIFNHIQNDMHMDKKQYCLNRVTENSSKPNAVKHFVTHPQSYNTESKQSEKLKKGIETTPQAPNELDQIFSHYSIEKLNSINEIDLRNNYVRDPEKETIHCLICQVDVEKNDASSHTDDPTHRHNKLFYNFVQNRFQCGDIDYIVLGNNWVLCRYCDHVILPSFSTELRMNHLQKDVHLDKKQYCLNRVADDSTEISSMNI